MTGCGPGLAADGLRQGGSKYDEPSWSIPQHGFLSLVLTGAIANHTIRLTSLAIKCWLPSWFFVQSFY